MGAAEPGTNVTQHLHDGEQRILDIDIERFELRSEVIVELDLPRHLYSLSAMCDQGSTNAATTASPIAGDAVRPGLSMP